MRDEDIHVGDVLRIRDWDDMASEYSVNMISGIRLPGGIWFANKMRYLCGEVFTVASVEDRLAIPDYRSYENVEYDKAWGVWTITSDMLEPYPSDTSEDEDFTPCPVSELMEFLNSQGCSYER